MKLITVLFILTLFIPWLKQPYLQKKLFFYLTPLFVSFSVNNIRDRRGLEKNGERESKYSILEVTYFLSNHQTYIVI